MVSRLLRILGVLAGTLLVSQASLSAEPRPLLVFTAASAAAVLEDAAADYMALNDVAIVIVPASSSVLARQIVNGAPANLYISANPGWMDYLQDNALVMETDRFPIFSNSLVVVVPANADFDPGEPLATRLSKGRIAICQPEHVPCGVYARQALGNLGLWESIEPRIVAAANARTTLAWAERGEVDAAIVYATDGAASKKTIVANAIPPASHESIEYQGAIIGKNTPEISGFVDFLRSSEAAETFLAAGFLPIDIPNDTTP